MLYKSIFSRCDLAHNGINRKVFLQFFSLPVRWYKFTLNIRDCGGKFCLIDSIRIRMALLTSSNLTLDCVKNLASISNYVLLYLSYMYTSIKWRETSVFILTIWCWYWWLYHIRRANLDGNFHFSWFSISL